MSAAAAVAHGGCRCRRTRFTLRGAPIGVGVCHCDSCRRATGSAFATYVDAPRAAVTFEGEAAAVYPSAPGVERLFCAACGSPIAYLGPDQPEQVALHLGAFDDPTAFTPDNETGVSDALAWARAALAPLMSRGTT